MLVCGGAESDPNGRLGRGLGTGQQCDASSSSGKAPGILAYAGEVPVGWCSIGPRSDFSALERSRIETGG
jgi:hypothetical protein